MRYRNANNKCLVTECGQNAFCKGYCKAHYQQIYDHGRITSPVIRKNTGKLKHPLYSTWANMMRRCNDPKNISYPNYGGRGIKVCGRWSRFDTGFSNFVLDMGPRPDGFSLDRIDNDGDYSPENCKWSSRREQNTNRRNNRSVLNVYRKGARKDGSPIYQVAIRTNGRTLYKNFDNLDSAEEFRDKMLNTWELE